MKNTMLFLRELKVNNNREWFAAHRQMYEDVLASRSRFTEAMIKAVASVDSRASLLTERDCTYRIYRDTRFSADKTPYKHHIGIFINPPYGKKSPLGGYYFHLEPDKCMFAAGNVCHESKVLTAIRRSIAENIEEYDEMMNDGKFRSIFAHVGSNPLKTAPKGYARDWPYLEYVRPRDFVAYTNESADPLRWMTDADYLHEMLTQALRFNRFINYAICEALGLDF